MLFQHEKWCGECHIMAKCHIMAFYAIMPQKVYKHSQVTQYEKS